MADISAAQLVAQQSASGSLVSATPPLTLVDGRSLDARVQQIIGDGVLRFLTAQGALDIATRADLAVGSRVRLTILGTTGQISLSLVTGENVPPRLLDPAARIVTGPNSPATTVLPRAGDGSAASSRAGLAPQSGGAPQGGPNIVAQNEGVVVDVRARQPGAALPATADQAGEAAALNAVLSSAISSNVARQGSLAPVFANLAALQQRPRDLPVPLRDAVNRAAAASISLDEGITASGLVDAIANSGVFLENALAGGNANTVLSSDLKAVLLGLRDQLTKFLPQQGAPPAPIAAVSGAAPEKPEAIAADGAPGTLGSRGQNERPAAPRRGDIPQAQRPALGDIPATANFSEIASHLLDQTEAALSRIRLSQLVSRHGDQPAVPGDQKLQPTLQTSYYVEIPVQIRQQTTTLQVAVEREAQPAGTTGLLPTYRLWFALDSEPAGPVSAVITWQPGNASGGVSATLWAERETTGRALRDGLSDLRRDLRQADLPIGEVAARLGKPRRPDQGGGHYVDRQT